MSDRGRAAAAIDIGSNSVHLLVVSLEGEERRVVTDVSELLGLGAVVDMQGRIPEEAASTALELVGRYVREAEEQGADAVILLATEPLRRASNRSHICDLVRAATGRPLHVLSHEEEAALTVLGVLDGEAATEPTLVLDIGGGSSEIVLLEPGADPVIGVLPVGSARLTASFVEDDPPTAEEIQALRSEAHRLVSGMPVGHPARGIVTGGSGTNLVRLVAAAEADERQAVLDEAAPAVATAEGADDETSDEVDGADFDEDLLIDKVLIGKAIRLVMRHPSADLVDAYGLRERRIVQMAAGASLIEAALDCYGLPHVEASDASLREGAILAWQRAGEAWRERLPELIGGGSAASGS
jgi:exopolyphosphatase / guanosine-5'-triphosphate,3'-diphosphate pyrophosphatase